MDKSALASTPSPELLEAKRGPIDGQRFFSRSPFRSGSFILATSGCLISVLCAVYILYKYWPRLSMFAAAVIWTVGLGLVRTWWRAFQYIGRVRDLYSEGSVGEVEPGSPLDTALGVAAGAINEILLFSFGITMLLLGYTRDLLSRLPVK